MEFRVGQQPWNIIGRRIQDQLLNEVYEPASGLAKLFDRRYDDIETDLLRPLDIFFGLIPFGSNLIKHPELFGCQCHNLEMDPGWLNLTHKLPKASGRFIAAF